MEDTLKLRIADWALALGLLVALQLQLAIGDRPGSTAIDLLGGALITVPLAWRRRAPIAVLFVYAGTAVVSEALGGGIFSGGPPPAASILAGMAVFYSLGAHAEDREALFAGGLGGLALWATILISGEIDPQSFVYSGGLVGAIPWLVGRTTRARRLRAADLEREQEQRTRLAVSEERARIARELHDVVAHSVGVMVVQAAGARRVLDRDPEQARTALDAIEQTGRTALADMRRSLGMLRAEDGKAPLEPQPGLDDLAGLIEPAREAGLAVEVVREGAPRPLPQGVDLSAYRIVQEALTNTIKHAGPVATRIRVGYGESVLELEVADAGPGPPPGGTEAEAGHGLMGMRERVAALGGELSAGPGPEGGFVVRASLPLGT